MPTIDNPLLVRMLAERLNATPHYLPAPMIVESVSVRDALARDPYFRSTLDLCGRADVALIGIGAADPDQSGPVRAGYLTPAELERTRADGAVGDIVVEYYDLSGHILETEFGSRVMGMRQQQLRNAGTVIAVAGGAGKVAAILGAVRTGLIDVLVTDNVTARQVLELDDAAPVNDRAIPELAANPSPGSAVPSPANNKPHRSLLDATFALLDSARDPRMSIAALSAEADRDMRKRWRSQLVAAITRASEKGEPGATIDPGSLADMLLGAIWYRSLIEDTPADEAVIGEIIGSVEGTGEARPKAES